MTSPTNEPAPSRDELDHADLLDLGLDPAVKTPGSGPGQFALPDVGELSARIPDLEFLEPIGSGGMGGVFLAKQLHLDRLVAVKVLPAELGRDSKFAERFAREARALAKLVHPAIVAIHDFGQADDLSYLVMEYADGMSLRELLETDRINPEETLETFERICEAIQYAHDEGIVHRDIKPENILFDRRGNLKIADFGLAKITHAATEDITLTGSRQAMGTLHYMAPEQWENPQSVDHRADVYALGVLLYEMLTGKLPLGSFEPPSDQVAVDPAVDDVVVRAMQREPDNRYDSVATMAADINPMNATWTFEPTRDRAHPDGRGTFTKFVDIGRLPIVVARRLMQLPRKSPPQPLEKRRWHIPFGTGIAFFAVLLLTSLPWIHSSRNRSYPGFFTSTDFGGTLFDNYFPFIAMAGILLAALLNRLHPIRSHLFSMAFAAYGVLHVCMFYAAINYVASRSVTGPWQRTVAPLIIGAIMVGILLDRFWSLKLLLDEQWEEELGKRKRGSRTGAVEPPISG